MVAFLAGAQIYFAWQSGHVGFPFADRRRSRAQYPVIFWLVIVFWLAVIALCLYRIATL